MQDACDPWLSPWLLTFHLYRVYLQGEWCLEMSLVTQYITGIYVISTLKFLIKYNTRVSSLKMWFEKCTGETELLYILKTHENTPFPNEMFNEEMKSTDIKVTSVNQYSISSIQNCILFKRNGLHLSKLPGIDVNVINFSFGRRIQVEPIFSTLLKFNLTLKSNEKERRKHKCKGKVKAVNICPGLHCNTLRPTSI